MKQAMNFRLSTQVISVLLVLENNLHLSKTKIVENALLAYANKLPTQQPLLKHAGVMSETNAEDILKTVRTNKHNKKVMPTL